MATTILSHATPTSTCAPGQAKQMSSVYYFRLNLLFSVWQFHFCFTTSEGHFELKGGHHHALLLLASTTLLRGRCSRYNSPPVSSGMHLIFCCPDSSHVSVDTVHPYLLLNSVPLLLLPGGSLSSNDVVVSSLHVSKPPQSSFSAHL